MNSITIKFNKVIWTKTYRDMAIFVKSYECLSHSHYSLSSLLFRQLIPVIWDNHSTLLSYESNGRLWGIYG